MTATDTPGRRTSTALPARHVRRLEIGDNVIRAVALGCITAALIAVAFIASDNTAVMTALAGALAVGAGNTTGGMTRRNGGTEPNA